MHVHLPNLGGKRQDFFQAFANGANLQIRGIHGEHSESADHIYDISNKQRLGRSEIELLADMHKGVRALLRMERSIEIKEAQMAEAVRREMERDEL